MRCHALRSRISARVGTRGHADPHSANGGRPPCKLSGWAHVPLEALAKLPRRLRFVSRHCFPLHRHGRKSSLCVPPAGRLKEALRDYDAVQFHFTQPQPGTPFESVLCENMQAYADAKEPLGSAWSIEHLLELKSVSPPHALPLGDDSPDQCLLLVDDSPAQCLPTAPQAPCLPTHPPEQCLPTDDDHAPIAPCTAPDPGAPFEEPPDVCLPTVPDHGPYVPCTAPDPGVHILTSGPAVFTYTGWRPKVGVSSQCGSATTIYSGPLCCQ